jgi:hypothetical protein
VASRRHKERTNADVDVRCKCVDSSMLTVRLKDAAKHLWRNADAIGDAPDNSYRVGGPCNSASSVSQGEPDNTIPSKVLGATPSRQPYNLYYQSRELK